MSFYTKITGSSSASIGTVIAVFRSSSGSFDITQYPGYIECDGSEVDVSKYPALYSVIGTYYGGTSTVSPTKPLENWEDDTTASLGTFKLPNFRGRKLVGVGGVDGAGSPSVIPSFDELGNAGGTAEDPGCTGGSWIMNETRQGAEYFIGSVVTSGYSNVTTGLNNTLSGTTSIRVGPLLGGVLGQPPEHNHILLTSEVDPTASPKGEGIDNGDPAETGTHNVPEYGNGSVGSIYAFEPPDGSLEHTHRISEINFNSTRIRDATYDSSLYGSLGSGNLYYNGTVGQDGAALLSSSNSAEYYDKTVSVSDSGMFISGSDFELTAAETIVVDASIVPDGDIPLLTKYHRVKYLIKAY